MTCRISTRLAFTAPASRVIYVCPDDLSHMG
jgi:hypothetical protein